MTFSELKSKLSLLKSYGFIKSKWSKSYEKRINCGNHYHCRYIKYEEIKEVKDLKKYLDQIQEDMSRSLEYYIQTQIQK